jgi:hypothetical protein
MNETIVLNSNIIFWIYSLALTIDSIDLQEFSIDTIYD